MRHYKLAIVDKATKKRLVTKPIYISDDLTDLEAWDKVEILKEEFLAEHYYVDTKKLKDVKEVPIAEEKEVEE